MTTYDAIVVGAGFAGITAARDLTDRGRSVLVLEAGDRIGGRTYSRAFAGREDLRVELGGSWINRDIQPAVRREVQRYGIELTEDLACENATFLTDGTLRSFPVPANELADLERAVGHLRELSKRIAPSQRLTTQHLQDLDVSADAIIESLGLGPATRDLLYAGIGWYSGANPREVSMLGFLAQIAGFGHSPLGFYSSLTERFAGGAGVLLERMVAQSRLEVRLEHRVVGVQQSESGVVVGTQDGQTFDAHSCVVAAPTNVLRHMEFTPALSEGKRRHLATNHQGRAYKPSILVRDIPRRAFALGTGTLQSICLGYELEDGSSLVMGFGGEGAAVIDPTDLQQVQQAVREYYPTATVLAVDAHDWNADPLFDGTYRLDRPGEALDFLREMNEPEDRIVFAGTDLDDSVWRIWIEGAIASGGRAADTVNVILRRS